MKKKLLIVLIILGAIIVIPSIVEAMYYENLTIETVPDVFYYRRGNDLPHGSGSFDKYSMNGKTTYCIEPSVPIDTNNYIGQDGFVYSPYSEAINKKIELIGHYGYDYPGHQTTRFRMATQALIWETVSGQIVEYWTERSGHGTHIDVSYERNIIMDLVNKHYNKPSFNSTSHNATVGQEIVITDTNGVLSEYEVYAANNMSVSINGNNLHITPEQVGDLTLQLVRKHYDNYTTIIFTGQDVRTQKMGLLRFSDPVVAQINLDVVGGKVELDKLDNITLTNTPRGEATLSGARYGVYKLDGSLISEIITNDNAEASTDNILELGRYYLQEITPPTGYELDTTKYFFEITTNDLNAEVDIYEQVINRDVEISKFYASNETGMLKPEVNIEFEIYDFKNELIDTIITDKDGYAKLNLVYGTYTFKQINTTEGYEKVEDFEVIINENSPQKIKYSLSNALITAKLKLEKVDSESGKIIAYAGVEFKIKDLLTNEYVCQTVSYPSKEEICIFSTNENGEFTTPYPLAAGTYQLEEISSPSGYILSGNHVIFTIDENSEILEDNFGEYIKVIYENEKIKGQLTINKKGEIPEFKDNQIKYELDTLEGIKFGIYAREEISTLDGVIHYEKDQLVKEIVTDETGSAILDNLILGKYYLKELETLPNYVLDETIYEFELTEIDHLTSIVYETINITNQHKKGSLEFSKTDFITSEPIPNTIIQIYNENDELLFIKNTDDEGKVVIEELPIGKYYIKEYEAATGYLITEEIVYFEIKEDGEIVKAEMKNKAITGTLEFTKVDFSTSEPLPNTKIEIYTEKDVLVYSGTTDEAGMIIINELRFGKYYILEVEAPEGYILNDVKMPFEIKEDGEIVKATMTNEKVIVEVPDTETSGIDIIKIIGGLSVVVGMGIFLYGRYKKKK